MFKKFIVLFIFVIMFSMLSITAYGVSLGSSDGGWDIFDPFTYADNDESGQYRYGPSIIVNDDGSIDMWLSSPGSVQLGQWDWIRYRHSTDGGQTWTQETVVLTPTAGSADNRSCCDPGVIKLGSYYYIGYTSINNDYGNNHLFVARSTSPSGPFEKWNGSGWGGDPQPFITHNGPANCFGLGEPSFVEKDGTLYIYYSAITTDSNNNPVVQTRLATANASNSNWPGNLTQQGIVIEKPRLGNYFYDSVDVKYVDSLSKFIAVGVFRRMSPYSHIAMSESTDGITFTPSNTSITDIDQNCHNVGISGTTNGHLDTSSDNYIAYAYGVQWGKWHTRWKPFSITTNNNPAVPEIYYAHPQNGSVKIYFRPNPNTSGLTYKVKYGTTPGTYTTTISNITGSPYTVSGLTNGVKYYFVVVSSSSNGDSGNSPELSTTPLNYSVTPRLTATASSQITGWEASKIIDSDSGTTWSSNMHATSNAVEWVYVDTGANRAISRVTVTPRQNNEFCYSVQKIQVSTDAVNWADADYDNMSFETVDSYRKFVYQFRRPLYGRYVRIYTGILSCDPYINYYMQIGEIEIEQLPYSVTTSSTLQGWPEYRLIDGCATNWSSAWHSSANADEWVRISLGDQWKVTGVRLKGRTESGADGTCFPVDFNFEYSNNGTTWYTIDDRVYSGYANPGSKTETFRFGNPVSAKYIRLHATKLSSDGYGNYYMQLDEFYIDTVLQRTVTASSSIPGWEPARAGDNNNSTCWSSIAHSTENATEWVAIDLGSAKNVTGLRVIPRPYFCFPRTFRIEYSNDGTNWTTVNRQSYTNYGDTKDWTQIFYFNGAVNARYFRIYATKLQWDNSNYYFQLGEVYAEQ